MDCVNKVCVGQPCREDSECPHREECFARNGTGTGKCLKTKKVKKAETCHKHEDCSARNQTLLCAKKK